MPPTLLLHPRIYLSADGETTDALLWDEGRIVATGEAARAQAGNARRISPGGACVFPALADAHVHLWGLGLRAGSLRLDDCTSARAVHDALRGYDLDDAPGGWILGSGWDQMRWDDAHGLDRDVVDTLHPGVPVALWRVDRHAIFANSEAMRRAGIGEGWQPRGSGHALRDRSGRLTGVFVDEAMDPILAAIPKATDEEDFQVFLESAARLRGHGVASAHVAWMPLERMSMLRRAHGAGELPLRLYLMLDGSGGEALDEWLHRGPVHDEQAWLSSRAVKFFADGALGSGGARLLEPYPDGDYGLELEPAESLARRSRELMEAGWQVATHAIGDAAARQVLDAYAGVDEATRQAARPRLEHAQMLHPDDCARLVELGVIASIQPIHLRSDAAWAEGVLAEAQLERLFPWRRYAAGEICAGSDYPIEDPNPWHGIATALTRLDAKGRPFRPEQALTRQEILAAYTTGAARAAHWEGVLGRLEPGYAADLIVLDRDPFEVEAEALWDVEVEAMWIGGAEVG